MGEGLQHSFGTSREKSNNAAASRPSVVWIIPLSHNFGRTTLWATPYKTQITKLATAHNATEHHFKRHVTLRLRHYTFYNFAP